MDIGNFIESSKPIVIAMGLKVLGAIVIYIVGRMLIGLVGTIITKAMERQKIEPTVIRYIADAIARLKAALPAIANVVKEPRPDVEILTFNERGPVLAVRPYVHTDHYWQVYFDTNKVIRETFGAAGYPAAEAHMHVRHRAA